MTHVDCSVSNCVYWGEGNRCRAEKIFVTLNEIASKGGLAGHDEEIGELGIRRVGETPARTSVETCCHTFKPRE
ncbi:MAG TPA: DUF1540 domain-containing protein [Limnochordia bacterium]